MWNTSPTINKRSISEFAQTQDDRKIPRATSIPIRANREHNPAPCLISANPEQDRASTTHRANLSVVRYLLLRALPKTCPDNLACIAINPSHSHTRARAPGVPAAFESQYYFRTLARESGAIGEISPKRGSEGVLFEPGASDWLVYIARGARARARWKATYCGR